jgi:hypothetical protein
MSRRNYITVDHHGFSLVGLTIAMGVALGSSTAIVMAYQYLHTSIADFTVHQASLELENEIIMAFSNQQNFSPYQEAMLKGTVPKGLSLSFNGKEIAVVGSLKYFDSKAGACDPTKNSCPLSTYADIECSLSGNCFGAYRISFDGTQTKSKHPLGSPGTASGAFEGNDYNIPLPYFEIQLKQGKSKCTSGPALGINRDTGALICSSIGSLSCTRDEIPLGLELVGSVIQVKCGRLKSFSCPPDYVASEINLESLHPLSPNGAGKCVFAGRDLGPWSQAWPSGESIVDMRVCPAPYYRALGDGACHVRVEDVVNGTQTVMKDTNNDGVLEAVSEPVGPKIGDPSYSIYDENRAECSYSKPASQPSGASFKVDGVYWSGNCKLKSEYQP